MPEISRFLGLLSQCFIKIIPPSIRELSLLDGKLPSRVLGLVIEWASLYQEELLEDWKLAEQLQTLKPIEPLE